MLYNYRFLKRFYIEEYKDIYIRYLSGGTKRKVRAVVELESSNACNSNVCKFIVQLHQ